MSQPEQAESQMNSPSIIHHSAVSHVSPYVSTPSSYPVMQQTLAASSSDDEPEEPPPYVRALWQMDGHLPFEDITEDEFAAPEWGFVIFRTAGYDDQALWTAAKQKLDGLVLASFDPDIQRDAVGARKAMEHFSLRFVEEEGLAGATPGALAARYREMRTQGLPIGMDHSLFLAIDEGSLESLRDATGASAGEGGEAHGRCIAFLKAVAAGADALDPAGEDTSSGKKWRGWFNVAVECIVGELFPDVANQAMEPKEMGVGLGEDDVWCGIANTKKCRS